MSHGPRIHEVPVHDPGSGMAGMGGMIFFVALVIFTVVGISLFFRGLWQLAELAWRWYRVERIIRETQDAGQLPRG